jgi:hypothetical protein
MLTTPALLPTDSVDSTTASVDFGHKSVNWSRRGEEDGLYPGLERSFVYDPIYPALLLPIHMPLSKVVPPLPSSTVESKMEAVHELPQQPAFHKFFAHHENETVGVSQALS